MYMNRKIYFCVRVLLAFGSAIELFLVHVDVMSAARMLRSIKNQETQPYSIIVIGDLLRSKMFMTELCIVVLLALALWPARVSR